MDDEQDIPSVLHRDNTVLVATTLATLLLAGSALICRTGRRLSFSPHIPGLSITSPSSSNCSDAKKHGKDATDNANDDSNPKTRSKERRRRGKDPLKEVLKGGKKLKMLSLSRENDAGSSTSALASASTSPLPQIPQTGSSQRSASVTTSGRSVSSSTASSAAPAGPHTTGLSATARDSEHEHATAGSSKDTTGHAHDAGPPPAGSTGAGNSQRHVSEIPEPPLISTSSNSSPSASSSVTSPPSISDPSSSDSTVHLQTYPQHSSPDAQPTGNPWEWDGQGPETTFRKPPRFCSTSRGSPMPPSVSVPYPTRFPATSESAAFPPQHSSSMSCEDLTFPTLNTVPSPTSPTEASRSSVGGTGIGGSPRRVPTPRRTPTPGSGHNTPPPSLNTQTQIASLRGALEVARMREEKANADLDRYAKDFEMMRWENNTWRRRELELQAQIHHLMHQLQTYAALFASSMSPHGHAHLQVPTNGSGSPSSANGHAPPSPSSYPGMFPPNGMLSPVALNGQPYFAYPAAQHPPPPPQTHQQPNLFSLLFPTPGTNGTVSGSGSGSGGGGSGSASESSVGSVSPDLVGSPTPFDRGRRRTRTQTAEARLGGWEGEMAEGWVGVEVQDAGHEGDAEDGEDDGYEEEDGGFSALADAILKRPESIRVRSKRRDKDKDKDRGAVLECAPTEFTFPSISDFGNVHKYREPYHEPDERPPISELKVDEPAPGTTSTSGESNDASESEPVPHES
ncbi:hypothetical protein B0H15DRAFT_950900 [Mycena belliarum]|uniref:Uncharacterized protein n=1 Tax=Mycena belliarum TaxID=1033014 RepID=A0AAD6U619_9AGAR|nr:hypothetical protein B0H15DRAFT_950900 [Mycena belliae]